MLLIIHFRYPVLGMDMSIDYHVAGIWTLYVSLAMSITSGIDYVRKFFSVLSREGAQAPA